VLETERLVLREWRDEDAEPFAAMNADPVVMEHFPSLLARAQSDDLVTRVRAHFDVHGFGMWVVEERARPGFGGFIGLMHLAWQAHFTPAVEIGWRLSPSLWGRGLCTEGAQAALRYGFDVLKLDEIVSLTVLANRRSWRVMEKLGMHRNPADDFDHPRVSDERLKRHVLYRLRADTWRNNLAVRSENGER
jgi:ribosomal-protein-alanine N-acetyltransferase